MGSSRKDLAEKAAKLLAEAQDALHGPHGREQHRLGLERAIELAHAALRSDELDDDARTSARWTLLSAHTARADAARYGAGQLSRSAQRAPTPRDCEDGWTKVETIVEDAEVSGAEAKRIGQILQSHRATKIADRAAEAAAAARKIVDERNFAFTFHADPGFSFGEGWYLAAAAVLEGVAMQIEPDKPQTEMVRRFIRDAGLSQWVTEPRSRPVANKQLTDIVARGFRPDPAGARAKVRAAFLGDEPVKREIAEWVDERLTQYRGTNKVLLWVRYAKHHPMRNTTHPELCALTKCALAQNLVPVLVGDALNDGDSVPPGAADLTFFWKQPIFQGEDMRRAQLQFFEHLRAAHGLVGQIGVTTAGMDGPALVGLPTIYLTGQSNVRMREWVGAVPGYQELVRGENYLRTIAEVFARWSD